MIGEKYARALYESMGGLRSGPVVVDKDISGSMERGQGSPAGGRSLEDWERLLNSLEEALRGSPEFSMFFSSPLIPSQDKLGVLKNTLGEEIFSGLEVFLKILDKNKRWPHLVEILGAFRKIFLKNQGLLRGQVRSAVELGDGEKALVKKQIEKNLSQNVDLIYKVDPQLMGGIEARVGSYLFEHSMSRHMAKLNDFVVRRM